MKSIFIASVGEACAPPLAPDTSFRMDHQVHKFPENDSREILVQGESDLGMNHQIAAWNSEGIETVDCTLRLGPGSSKKSQSVDMKAGPHKTAFPVTWKQQQEKGSFDELVDCTLRLGPKLERAIQPPEKEGAPTLNLPIHGKATIKNAALKDKATTSTISPTDNVGSSASQIGNMNGASISGIQMPPRSPNISRAGIIQRNYEQGAAGGMTITSQAGGMTAPVHQGGHGLNGNNQFICCICKNRLEMEMAETLPERTFPESNPFLMNRNRNKRWRSNF